MKPLHLREACSRCRTWNGRLQHRYNDLCDSSGVDNSLSQFSRISRQDVINGKGQTN